MKPHPHIWKTIKWCGAVVTVLLVVVWIWSGRWDYWENATDGVVLTFADGALFVHRGDANDPPRRNIGSNAPRSFLPSRDFNPNGWYVEIPLCLLAVGCAAMTCVAWRLDTLARRRDRLNLCPKCNYDRTGLAAGAKCPECGSMMH